MTIDEIMTPDQRAELKRLYGEVGKLEKLMWSIDYSVSDAVKRESELGSNVARLLDLIAEDITSEMLKPCSDIALECLLDWFARWTDDIELELKSRAKATNK